MMRRQWLTWGVVVALLSGSTPAVVVAQGSPAESSEVVGVDDEAPIDLEALAKERAEALYAKPPNQRVARYLRAAGEELSDGNHDEAKRLLLRLDPKRLSPFERGQMYRLLAYVDYSRGEADDALAAFESAIAEQALPLKDEVDIMFNVVQLHASLQDWPAVIRSMDRWQRYVLEPTPQSHYLRSIAYYQMEQYELALSNIQKAVELKPEPPESWLQLLAALYVLNGDYASVTPVLEELVMRFPKKAYWVQLSLIYGAREDYRHSLAVQQIAYAQGLLTEDNEQQRLARSYVFAGLPYESAQVLEKGLDSGAIKADDKAYEFLANSWIQAREYDKAIGPLQKAAELSDTGNLYLRLGQVRMQREEWADAVTLFQKAIEKGDLTDPGNADLLLGIAYYNDNRPGPARVAFGRARQHEKSRKAADDWIKHMERESESQEIGSADATGSRSDEANPDGRS
jgi:tetratricopeptide (TPR) repeat protein